MEKNKHDDSENKKNQAKYICSFYRKGTYRYGVSDKECRLDHKKTPKVWRQRVKWIRIGSFYQAKMCKNSLSKGECSNPDCKLHHVRDTRYTQQDQGEVNTNNGHEEKKPQ